MRCGSTHFRPTYSRRYPCPWTGGHGSLCDLYGVRYFGGATTPCGPQRQKIPLSGARSSVLPSLEIPPPAAAGTLPSAPIAPAPPCLDNPHTASCARLLQTADIPPETARLVRCHNLWPTEDVLFCPNDALPAFVTGIPALSSGPELWLAVHNHRSEPLQLHSGQRIGVLEVVTLT